MTGVPTVYYIAILGYAEDGNPVYDRVPKTDRGREVTLPPDDSHWVSGAKTWGRDS